jgi:hypothetical protein
MKLIVTIKTKNKNPSQKQIDKTVDMVLEVGELLHNTLNFKEKGCKIYSNGTSLILTK